MHFVTSLLDFYFFSMDYFSVLSALLWKVTVVFIVLVALFCLEHLFNSLDSIIIEAMN